MSFKVGKKVIDGKLEIEFSTVIVAIDASERDRKTVEFLSKLDTGESYTKAELEEFWKTKPSHMDTILRLLKNEQDDIFWSVLFFVEKHYNICTKCTTIPTSAVGHVRLATAEVTTQIVDMLLNTNMYCMHCYKPLFHIHFSDKIKFCIN